MRLTRLPVALVTAGLLVGAASCAATIEGSGSVASDVIADGPAPTGGSGSEDPGGSDDPDGSDDPTPTASPTVEAVQIRQRALCVLERAAISGINTSFNKSKQRNQQIQILRQGAATIQGQLSRSRLPTGDTILRAGTLVHTELSKLYTAADAGKSPSTKPYNDAAGKFQRVCNSIS